MLRRLILTFALALLFGLGQQGVIVHEISHYADLVPQSQKQDKTPHSPVCEQCLSHSALANAVDTGGFSPALLNAVHEAILHANAAVRSNPPLYAYSARAPPSLV